jgi:hypothetical protein
MRGDNPESRSRIESLGFRALGKNRVHNIDSFGGERRARHVGNDTADREATQRGREQLAL